MKKRTILALFPLLGLLLTGCDLKATLLKAKSFVKENVYGPARKIYDEFIEDETPDQEKKEDSGKTDEHVHSYDTKNIEWVWSETASGDYSAKAVLECSTCDEKTEGHSLELTAHVTSSETKAPTCSTPGTMTYTATVSYEGKTYSATKDKAITDVGAHHYVELQDVAYLKSAATCTEDAVYYKSCEYCHEKGEETFTVENSKLGHHMIYHAASGSTCQEHGNIEHYECDRCNKLFADENGATELTASQVELPLAHHYLEVQDAAYLKSAATCTEDAVYFVSCEFCHEKGEETFTVENSKLGHHMTHFAATTSTCQEHGHIDHYECDRCNKYFADENGANELAASEVELPLAHKYIEVQDPAYLKSEATCTEDAVYYKTCEYCHEKTEETFTVENSKLGHHMTHHAATTSTCQVHGNVEYYDCDRCNKYFADENGANELAASEIELPLEHSMTYHAEVAPTCENDGTKAYYTCAYEDGVKYKDENGEEKYNNDSELVIAKLNHEFNASLNCVRGDTTLKDEYEMADASAQDAFASATISDLGLTSGAVIPSGTSHLWGNYDYVENGGIDLWFKMAYPTPEGGTDYYTLFYLFNDGGEGGIVLRFGLSRAENDGIVPIYIYTAANYSGNPGTTVIQNAGAAGTFFYLPRSSGVKSSTDNIFHLRASCLDATTNLFRCWFTVGVEGGEQWYPSTNPEAPENIELSFDICLGANYFNGGAGRKVRMSCNAANRATIYDVASAEKVLVYKDAAGNVVGKLNNPASAKIPTLVAENKTFLGWFDTKGNKVNDGDPVTTKTIITPRFIDTQDKMFVPSDTLGGEFLSANGGWYSSDSFEGECGGQLPVSEVTDRFDLYFNYRFVSRSASDNYAIFGFPFDFIDAQTRLHLRIDNKENGNLVGYIYGPNSSLGGAGAAGTMFSEAGFRANGSDLLIHMAVYNASGAGLTMLVEIVNLGNGQVFQTTRDVTFNTADLYSISSPTRNVFDLMKANCTYQISDAF